MAREKKTQKSPEVERPADTSTERVSEPVKLRPTFKKRLQRVAEDAGIDMGVLIEQHMGAFVNREIKRLAEKDLKDLAGE